MRKFFIHSFKGDTTIMEVEIEVMPKSYFTSLKEGEWMGKVTAPTSLYEKQNNGILTPPIYCWWAFYDSVETCKEQMEKACRLSLIRLKRKMSLRSDIPVEPASAEEIESEVAESISKVKIVWL